MHGAEEEVERPTGQQLGDLAHPAGVVVDLEAEPDGDRRAVGRRAQYGVGVGVEIAGGVGGPVGGRLRPEPAVGVGVPPAAEQAVGLAEAEEVLGDADLLDAPGGGRLGVGAHRLDPVRAVLSVPQ